MHFNEVLTPGIVTLFVEQTPYLIDRLNEAQSIQTYSTYIELKQIHTQQQLLFILIITDNLVYFSIQMIGICDLNNETVYSLVWRLRYRQCIRKCI